MPVLSDDIQLTAPAPGPVMGVSAQITGPPGLALYHYWWVATYPVGVTVVSAPVLVRNAPSPLSATNYVTITGQPALGATKYDLLRTNGPNLPSITANIAVATGLTSPTFNDQGAALTAYNVAGLAAGAPVSAFINLNNRDYAQPTLVFSPFPTAVKGLVFPDGSTQSTAFTSAQVYNWTQNVQANLHQLQALNLLQLTSSDNANTYNESVFPSSSTFAPGGRYVQQGTGDYRFVVNAAGDVWVGPQTTPTGNRLNSRFLITNPPDYATPTNQMLYLYNPTNQCQLSLEGPTNAKVNLVTSSRIYTFSLASTLFQLFDGANVRMTINTSGFIGLSSGTIATFTPAHTLDLNTDDAGKTVTNTWTITSDIRTKRNVKPLEGGLSIIEQLQPIEAQYNGCACTPDGKTVISFDPDELVKVLPRAVSRVRRKLQPDDFEETEIGCVNPHEILHHLVLAVQQLSRQIKEKRSNANRPGTKS